MLAKSTTLCKLLPRDCGYSDQAESAASKFRTRQPLDANNHTNTSRSSVTTEKSKYHAGTRQLQQITWNTHTHTHIQHTMRWADQCTPQTSSLVGWSRRSSRVEAHIAASTGWP